MTSRHLAAVALTPLPRARLVLLVAAGKGVSLAGQCFNVHRGLHRMTGRQCRRRLMMRCTAATIDQHGYSIRSRNAV
jgi:hypothetical protein